MARVSSEAKQKNTDVSNQFPKPALPWEEKKKKRKKERNFSSKKTAARAV